MLARDHAGRPCPELPVGATPLTLRPGGVDGATALAIRSPISLVGSRRDCALAIPHPDVSRVHCAIIHTGRSVFVCDLRSRMGTFVNEQFANLSELLPGVKLRVGPVEVGLEFGQPHDAQAAWNAARSPTPLRLRGHGDPIIENAAAVIGRRTHCDVCIDAPDVSLAHALLFFIDGCPAICDLGSRSGTFLNEQHVTLAWLRDGDALRIGATTWQVEWAGPIGYAAEAENRPRSEKSKPRDRGGRKRPHAASRAARAARAPEETADQTAVAADDCAMDAETAPRIRFDEITGKDLVEIGRTANALYGTLERARRALDARTAELRQRELTIAKRELELAAREKEIEAREAGGEAAQAQIAQFRVALQMAQTWFSATDSAASGAAKKPGGLSASKIGAEAPLIAKPLFGNASGGAGRSNGNGATRLGHARADADAARSRVQSQFN